MAAKKKPAPTAPTAPTSYEIGPYELVEDVNSLSFGADPVVVLEAGTPLTTEDEGVAEFLEGCEHVRLVKGGTSLADVQAAKAETAEAELAAEAATSADEPDAEGASS